MVLVMSDSSLSHRKQSCVFAMEGGHQYKADFSRLGTSNQLIDRLLILNCDFDQALCETLIRSSKMRILVDGGANRYYDTVRDPSLINLIIGDLDSIRPSVLQYYRNYSIPINHILDQDSTDYEKALSFVSNESSKSTICVLSGKGGRMDHTISCLSSTAKICRRCIDTHIFIIDNSSLTMYLHPQVQYEIVLSQFEESKKCGVVTFGQVEEVETSGLKWNMGMNHPFKSIGFGSFLSTSNEVVSEPVRIKVSQEAFWISQFPLQMN